MARLPRPYLPGCAQHIIQRGNNRAACFNTQQDYTCYLHHLKEAAEKYHVAIHSFAINYPGSIDSYQTLKTQTQQTNLGKECGKWGLVANRLPSQYLMMGITVGHTLKR